MKYKNKIISVFLEPELINKIKPFLPDYEWINIESMDQLYLESIEGFTLALFDHKQKITKYSAEIHKFIESTTGVKSYGIQWQQDQCFFIQYIPVKKFSFNDFLTLKPWVNVTNKDRNFIRFSQITPVEVIKMSTHGMSMKTSAMDISIRGFKLIGDYYESETIRVKTPIISNVVFEATVKWADPWGTIGKIAVAGCEILHDTNDTSYKALLKLLKGMAPLR